VCACAACIGEKACVHAQRVSQASSEREREREKERVCVCARASKLMTEQKRGSTCTRDRKYVRM